MKPRKHISTNWSDLNPVYCLSHNQEHSLKHDFQASIYSFFSSQAKGKSVFRMWSANRFSQRDSSQYKARLWMQKSLYNLDILLINTTAHFKPQPLAAHQLLLSSNLWGLFLWDFFPPYPFIPYLYLHLLWYLFDLPLATSNPTKRQVNGKKNKSLISFCYIINAVLQTDTGNL